MYIHIGGDVSLPTYKILGIFDIEKTSVNKDVNDYLMKLQKQGKIYYVFLRYAKELYCNRGLCLYIKRVGFYAEKAVFR